MQCSRLLYPFAWLPTSAKHHGQKVTRLSDFENDGYSCAGKKATILSKLWLIQSGQAVVVEHPSTMLLRIPIIPNPVYLRCFSGGLW